MGKIVAIGGVTRPHSLDSIDYEIIRLTGKKNARVLYIPTAGGDDLRNFDLFRSTFEGKFDCSMDILLLIKETPAESDVFNKVFSSDIVYVEGGSISRLIDNFKRYDMDKILKEAYSKGIVLAGKSAGALCWGKFFFETENNADFTDKMFKNYTKVECLNYIDFLICPHYNFKGFPECLEAMVDEFSPGGVAIDNDCAFEIVDGSYRVISRYTSANAYRVYKKESGIIREVIDKNSEFKNLEEINLIQDVE